MSLRLRLVPYALPFAAPLTTARGIVRERRGVLVTLERRGVLGCGEVALWPGFGSPAAEVETALAALGELRLDEDSTTTVEAATLAAQSVTAVPEVRGALLTALLDLVAQAHGCPLAALLSPTHVTILAVGALAIDVADAEASVTKGYRTLKLKVGAAEPADDVARVQRVRACVGTAIHLRVDANRAWSEAIATRAATDLAACALEFLEEPLANPTPAALARLRTTGGVPLALDETLGHGASEEWLNPEVCDVAVLKPGFLGGPIATVALGRRAQASGLGVTIGTAFESAIGRAMAMHVAAALAPGRACGLGSPLATDLAEMPPIERGEIHLPTTSGLGVRLGAGGVGWA